MKKLPLFIAAFLATIHFDRVCLHGADDEVIDLPPFEVQGTFPWTYAEAPGYEILSLARDRETRRIVERFLRAIRVAPIFLPPGWEAELSEPITLFLHHFDSASTLAALHEAGHYGFIPDNISMAQESVMVALPGEPVTRGWLRGRRSPLADHVSWLLLRQAQSVPMWYQKGVHNLLLHSSVTRSAVYVPAFHFRPGDAMPLEEVLAIASRRELAPLEQGSEQALEEFILGATLFVRWAFFSEYGARRSALLSFVDQASRTPVTEEMFADAFGMGIEQVQSDLELYARSGARSSESIETPDELLLEVPEEAVLASATHVQVARMLGRFYSLLGTASFPDQREEYFEKARTSYLDSFPAGERNARLMAELGFLDHEEGNMESAADRLAFALDPSVTDSRALVALATLRIKAAKADQAEDTPLADEAFASIMAPLRRAMTLRPPSQDAFLIAAALWLHHDATPSADDLALLERGARIYYHLPLVVVPVIEVHKNAGRTDVARDLIALLLALPNLTADGRAALLEERAALYDSIEPEHEPSPSH